MNVTNRWLSPQQTLSVALLAFKPVLNTASRSVHEASESFKKIGRTVQTYFVNSWTLRSFRPAEESSRILFDASGCV